jgi:hypothetical protein
MEEERVEVRRYRPSARRRLLLLLLLGLVVALGVSFQFGYRLGGEHYQETLRQLNEWRQQAESQQIRADTLEQQLANLERGAAVDRQVIEEVRSALRDARRQGAALQEEITFYKGLMDPGNGVRGLDLRSFELQEGDDAQSFDFKLVVQQVTTQHQLISGYATVTLLGQDSAGRREISLHELSEEVEEAKIPLRFRYFQAVEGSLSLPSDFEPHQVRLLARSSGRKGQTVEKLVDWST